MGMPVRGVGFVGVDVAMNRFAVVAVRVGVEVTAPPANEQPYGEEYSQAKRVVTAAR